MMVECKTSNEKVVFLSRGRTSEHFILILSIFAYIHLQLLTSILYCRCTCIPTLR